LPILELQGKLRGVKERKHAMRVNTDHGSQPLPESNRSTTAQAAGQNSQASGSAALGSDQAQLSGAGAQITALAAQVLQLPEVRQERVQALRQAVESGSYTPDARSTAGALVNHLALQPAA
jgi:flagellar biosynthesis anti-sigma factor FlgM